MNTFSFPKADELRNSQKELQQAVNFLNTEEPPPQDQAKEADRVRRATRERLAAQMNKPFLAAWRDSACFKEYGTEFLQKGNQVIKCKEISEKLLNVFKDNGYKTETDSGGVTKIM